MHSNINPYPSHPLSWKHIGILIAVIVALVAVGVIGSMVQAEAQEPAKKQYWSLTSVNPGQAMQTGQHHYRFTLHSARPKAEDWQHILTRIGDFQEKGGELQGFQALPCPEGICGTVFVRFPGQLQ